MQAIRDLIPSMFHRRLLLLLLGVLMAIGVLGGQLYRLTVVQGETWRDEAESVLRTTRLLPTVRGRILDRHDRVLAEDRPCYDVTISYPVLTGDWAYREARREAYADVGRTRWAQMSFDEREEVIAEYQRPYDAQVQRMWRQLAEIAGVDEAEIADRRQTIVRRVQTIRAEVWERRAVRRAAERGGPVELRGVAIPIAEEREQHTLLAAIDDDTAHEIRRIQDELPGIDLTRARAREYPLTMASVEIDRSRLPSALAEDTTHRVTVERLGAHLVGSMRGIWAEDVERRPFKLTDGSIDLGGYLPGDTVGREGIEQLMEDELRGIRGQVEFRRDSGETMRIPPQEGGDVALTIDMGLQARVRAIMDSDFGLTRVQSWHENRHTPSGTDLHGAAVVLEVDTGDVLAMVSTPVPPLRVPGEPYPNLWDHPDQPMLNRTLGRMYPPGSTMKPLMYVLAAAEGAVEVGEVISCAGRLFEDREGSYRCWGWHPGDPSGVSHGPLAPEEAVARSCNIYFYEAGRRLGIERLTSGLAEWGFGQRVGLLPGEVNGWVGPRGRAADPADSIFMGIGQGPVDVPPIQVAAAHATLARGGYYLSPVLVNELRHEQQTRSLRVPPTAIRHALDGMFGSTYESYGTGSSLTMPDGTEEPVINIDDVVVRSKTGTAQARPQERENAAGEMEVIRAGSHSWYVAHVAEEHADRASYVVVVMIEYGGSGGRVSGPVVNQILWALRDEGYL